MKTKFICQSCGHVYGKWLGLCKICDTWNSIEEIKENKKKLNDKNLKLSTEYLDSNIKFINELLGPNFIKSSFLLIRGRPSVGKTAFLIQLMNSLGVKDSLYISNEENISQITLRKIRPLKDLNFLFSSSWEEVFETLQQTNIQYIFIDSLTNLYNELNVSPFERKKNIIYELYEWSKKNNKTLICSGHMTKSEQTSAGTMQVDYLADFIMTISSDENELICHKNRFWKKRNAKVSFDYNRGFYQESCPL